MFKSIPKLFVISWRKADLFLNLYVSIIQGYTTHKFVEIWLLRPVWKIKNIFLFNCRNEDMMWYPDTIAMYWYIVLYSALCVCVWYVYFHRAGLNRGVPMGPSTQIEGGSFRRGLSSEIVTFSTRLAVQLSPLYKRNGEKSKMAVPIFASCPLTDQKSCTPLLRQCSICMSLLYCV